MSLAETGLRDLRDAIRSLRRRPAFSVLAVVTLALGIAVNAATMATAYGVLVRPLPYSSPQRIVVLNLLFPDGGDLGFSPSEVTDWLRRLNGVDAAAAYYTRDVTVRAGSHSTVVQAAFVTDRFFEVFGATPERGHVPFSADTPSLAVAHSRVAELLDLNVADSIGTSVTIGGTSRTVNAVLQPEFAFPHDQIGVWLPSQVPPLEPGYSKIVARLQDGVTVAQIREIAQRALRELNPKVDDVVSVTPLEESILGGVRHLMVATLIGSLLVLVVASANVATLFIGRDVGCRREFATRLVLGARRVDIVRTVLTEMFVFALLATLVGVFSGEATLRWFATTAAPEIPTLRHVRIDVAVAGAAFCLTLAVALLTGLVRVVHVVRDNGTTFLKPASSSRPGAWTLRRFLVISQIACCCVLLIGSGLLLRTVSILLHEDAGFDPQQGLAAKLVLSDVVLGGAERSMFVRALLERTRSMPGVRDAGVGSNLPPRTPAVTMSITVVTNGKRQSREVKVSSATPGFLTALGARFIGGRDFSEADSQTGVVVLSRSLARFYFGDRDPIGLTFASLPSMFAITGTPRVIGVVSDIKYDGLDAPASGAIYLPWSNRPFGAGYLVVRVGIDSARTLPDVRRIVAALDPTVPVTELLPLQGITAQSIAGRRMRAIPAAGFAMLAVAVCAVGIVATLSTLVAERRRDLAICAALGASSERLVWIVARQGVALTVVGVMAGLGLATIVARGLSSLLYGIRPYDALTFIGTAGLIIFISTLMTLVSALGTLRIEPMSVLRQE